MNKLTKKLDKNILKLKKLNVKPGGQNSILALRHPPIIPSCFWQIIFLLWAMIDKTLLYISLVKYLHYFKTSNKTNLCTITIFIITKFLFPSHIIRCQVMSMIPTYTVHQNYDYGYVYVYYLLYNVAVGQNLTTSTFQLLKTFTKH